MLGRGPAHGVGREGAQCLTERKEPAHGTVVRAVRRQRHPQYLKGVFLVVLGGVFISQSGVLIGSMENAQACGTSSSIVP